MRRRVAVRPRGPHLDTVRGRRAKVRRRFDDILVATDTPGELGAALHRLELKRWEQRTSRRGDGMMDGVPGRRSRKPRGPRTGEARGATGVGRPAHGARELDARRQARAFEVWTPNAHMTMQLTWVYISLNGVPLVQTTRAAAVVGLALRGQPRTWKHFAVLT